MIHGQRRKDMPANIVIPRYSGDSRNDLTGCHVEQIVVGVMAAETRRRLHATQLVNNFVASVGRVRPKEQISFAQTHATAVSQQIADGHLMRDVWVIHHESRKAL